MDLTTHIATYSTYTKMYLQPHDDKRSSGFNGDFVSETETFITGFEFIQWHKHLPEYSKYVEDMS
jgi:hypothetical protein